MHVNSANAYKEINTCTLIAFQTPVLLDGGEVPGGMDRRGPGLLPDYADQGDAGPPHQAEAAPLLCLQAQHLRRRAQAQAHDGPQLLSQDAREHRAAPHGGHKEALQFTRYHRQT